MLSSIFTLHRYLQLASSDWNSSHFLRYHTYIISMCAATKGPSIFIFQESDVMRHQNHSKSYGTSSRVREEK